MIGISLGAGMQARGGGFSPTALFAAGEQGYWLDPSDFGTMFQDTSGTVPVTAVGQSVARINDKSGRGNHFTQANAANRPILGREPRGGRRNLLLHSEAFDNPAWVKGDVTVTADTDTSPIGSADADTAASQVGVSSCNIRQGANLVAGNHTVSFWVKAGTSNSIAFGMLSGSFRSGTAVILSGPGAVSGSSIITLSGLSATQWTRVAFTFTATAATHVLYVYPEGVSVGTGKTVALWGAQLETGSTATPYQRVTTALDVTEAGVSDVYYLAFDGVDDWLQSVATINPGALDKAQVFAGVRKLSDAAGGTIVEASASLDLNNGCFHVRAPHSAATNYSFASKGTTVQEAIGSPFVAPITNVLTGLGDISGDSAILRVNGAQLASSSADQGTGNFLTYTHFIGRRAGTSLPLNGRIYQLITRYGPNPTAEQIAQTETFVNQRTGAF